MLKSKKKGKGEFAGFVAVDIENWPDGSVLSINTCWREPASGGPIVHARHTDWQSWWQWITERAGMDRRFRTVYAHNGGGWDWISFIAWILTDYRDPVSGDSIAADSVKICTAGSKIIVATVQVRDQFSIKLADSLQLLRSSLDRLATKFVGKGKIDLGGKLPHEIYLEDRELFSRYEDSDTELLLQVLENALNILQEKVAEIDGFATTIGGTAMRVFRAIGFDHPIMKPNSPELKALLRRGYTGGRVECFRPGFYDPINVYDVNSLYPFAMLHTDVPTTDRGIWVGENYRLQSGDVGVFEIEWEQLDRSIAPILCLNGEGVYSGAGVFFSPELQLLQELDPKAPIIIKSGFVFSDVDRIFQSYVERLYSLRKSDPNGPLSELCKFLLNSLYGKFGQHAERETAVAALTFDELYERVGMGESIRPLNVAAGMYLDQFGKAAKSLDKNLALPVYGITSESPCEFEHVGIAGIITSAARVILYRGILAAGFDRVVYCDTDSVHCCGDLPSGMVGSEIGQFKIEKRGHGAYAGKKLYALRDDGRGPIQCDFPRDKVRAKGVSVGGRNGADLCFDDIRALCDGEKRELSYKQPTTILELIGGKKPCVFQTRTRTLRKTATERYGKVQRKTEEFIGSGPGPGSRSLSGSGK